MPRVRRLRREAPTLELLAATLPELRLGLSDSGARTLAYEVFEKLGYGAVAVTDTSRVLAFVGAGADHHGPGDVPIRPVFEALAEDETRIAPLALRVACGHRACPLGAAAIVPLRLSDGPAGALVAYATDGAPLADDDVDLLTSLGDQLSAQLQLSELAGSARAAASAELKALQAEIEPHFLFNCLNTIASFIRTDPDRARELVLAFADYCRWTLARPGEFITLAEAVKHVKTERPLRLIIRARVRRGRLRVTVRDNGLGIAREALDRVLEPGVGEGDGAGLGLANVHQRLTAFYGEGVRLKSGGFGTVVRLDVPVGH